MKSPVLLENAARLEIRENGAAVWADFSRGPGRLILDHVEADEALQNTGAAERFMDAVVAHVREKKLKIESRCDFVDHWFDERPDLARELQVDRLAAQDGTQGALEDLGREGAGL